MYDEKAIKNYAKYEYMNERGHRDFCARADRNVQFYLGNQWTEVARENLRKMHLPSFTFNEIKPAVDTAIGYQIANRMDMQVKPTGGAADTSRAEIISKVLMHECNRNDYHFIETDVFRDGITAGRGFLDIRPDMSTDDGMGEIRISAPHYKDVLIDGDAKSYDPKKWKRVALTRWLSGDEIQAIWGEKIRRNVEAAHPTGESDFGDGGKRDRIGGNDMSGYYISGESTELATKRYRIVDIQERYVTRKPCLILSAGDITPVDSISKERYIEMKAMGARERPYDVEAVRWTISTKHVLIHDEDSPMTDFSIVMFTPLFAAGETLGMVDNAIPAQEAYNKSMSMAVHSINSSAQNILLIEQDSLHDTDIDDFENSAQKAGYVIQYKKGSAKPEKLGPNPVPPGLNWIMQQSLQTIRNVTMPEAMTGIQGQEVSGIAIQSKQFAAQQQLAVALDNLSRTRKIAARIMLEIVQKFYSGNRIIRITEIDPFTGRDIEKPIEINGEDPVTGGIMNDVTVGKYDVVITSQPMQITFDNSQFTQVMEMRKNGVSIPDQYAIKNSNLSDKFDIITEMSKQQGPVDPTLQAKADQIGVQTEKIRAEIANIKASTVETRATSIYTLTQAAGGLSANIHLVKSIDELGKSAGYEDQNGGQILPDYASPMGMVPDNALMPANTNPLTPDNPASPNIGVNQGIETPPNDMVTSDMAPNMGA